MALVAGLSAWMAIPGLAHAAGGGLSDEAFYNIVLLLAAVGGGYVVTNVALAWLAHRFAIVSGVEYIVLGAFVGPILGIIAPEHARDMQPILLLGAGALGMLVGLDVTRLLGPRPVVEDGAEPVAAPGAEAARAPTRLGMERGLGFAALAIALGTLLAMIGLSLGAITALGHDVRGVQAWTGAIIIVAAASLGSDGTPVRALAVYMGARGLALDRGVRLAGLSNVLAAIAFGLVFSTLEGGSEFRFRTAFEFARTLSVQIGGGAIIGLLFSALLRRRLDDRSLLAVIVGMIFFAGGFAFSMRVSAIFVNFVAGAVFISTCRYGEQVRETLNGVRRPFMIALFFFAGLEWVSGAVWTYVLVVPLLLLRLLGRRVGGGLSTRMVDPPTDLSAAAIAPGGLTVAFLLSTRLFYDDLPGVRDLYGPMLIAVVISEFLALRTIRRWLIDVADVPPEAKTRSGGLGIDLEGV